MVYFTFLLHLCGYLNTVLNVQEYGFQNDIKLKSPEINNFVTKTCKKSIEAR